MHEWDCIRCLWDILGGRPVKLWLLRPRFKIHPLIIPATPFKIITDLLVSFYFLAKSFLQLCFKSSRKPEATMPTCGQQQPQNSQRMIKHLDELFLLMFLTSQVYLQYLRCNDILVLGLIFAAFKDKVSDMVSNLYLFYLSWEREIIVFQIVWHRSELSCLSLLYKVINSGWWWHLQIWKCWWHIWEDSVQSHKLLTSIELGWSIFGFGTDRWHTGRWNILTITLYHHTV